MEGGERGGIRVLGMRRVCEVVLYCTSVYEG